MHRARATLCAILACLVLATPAAAAKPVMERVVVSEIGAPHDFLTAACGVDAFSDVTGHFILRMFAAADGTITRELNNFALHFRYYSEFGEVRAVDVGADRVTYNADGSITQVVIGNVQSISLPGQGRVYADVGQTTVTITFPPEGEPIVDVQPGPGQHHGDQLAVVCGVLAPAA